MTITDQTIDVCNELLRGELSAVETYNKAIAKFGDSSGDDMLLRIRHDHEDSVADLRRLIAEGGGEPSKTSGLWGGFATALEEAATLLGRSPALKVLQEGEEHGIKEYRDALDDPEVSGELKDLIREELLPRLSGHVSELQRHRDRIA